MAITPNTEIRLLKVPIEIDNKNQLTFQNKQKQYEYFSSLPYIEEDDCSYQRKDSVIEFPAHIDSILQYNYVMYQNENYSNKWFYGFITNMVYENDGLTHVYITTDVFQTWQFDINFKQSFIEREMINVADDVPGANLIPEGLETGEYKIGGTAEINGLKPYYIVAYSRNPYEDDLTSQQPSAQGIIVNGVASGLFYCICNNATIQGLLQTISNKGFDQSIVAVFSIPALSIVGFNGWTLDDLMNDNPRLYWIVSDFKANPITVNLINTPSQLDGYTPRNQKLRTYPFMYIGFNPLNGVSKIYRYEDFSNSPSFKVISEINPNPTICFIPQNYRGQSGDSLSDISLLNGYPQISWITDFYNSWLAQNSNIIDINMRQEEYNFEHNQSISQLQALTTGLSALGGKSQAISAGINLGIAQEQLQINAQNHAEYINMQLAQKEKQQLLPNSANLGTSATLLGYDLINDNVFTRYSIKKQFAERIDKYFDMYGYLTNTLKLPNLNNRPNWNYVKTLGANITGDIPQEDMQTIKNMFDNGITLWHNTNTFLDYSQNNR